MLDLSGFMNPEEAFRRASDGVGEYTEIVKTAMEGAESMHVAHMAFMAFASRARGLHEAILREITNENPYAAFPLLRAMAELTTIIMYANLKPTYIATVVGIGPTKFHRKSFQAMFAALKDQAPGLKHVYRELSEYTHMGLGSIANAMTPVDDESHYAEWTDRPCWRSANDYRVACAQTQELAETLLESLRGYAGLHLAGPDSEPIGALLIQQALSATDLARLRAIEEGDTSS